jgi:hypothetical protein
LAVAAAVLGSAAAPLTMYEAGDGHPRGKQQRRRPHRDE